MPGHRLPLADATLSPVERADFAALRVLATAIWHQHYPRIISAAQIDFMLAGRFRDEAILATVRATDRWLRLLRVAGTPVGYCGYELVSEAQAIEPPSMKLAQLYVQESHRHLGLGHFMLAHVETQARSLGRRSLVLQVNKRNTDSIGFYESCGFKIVREAVFDIGSGFVMDDYVMAKRIDPVEGVA